MKKSKLMKAFFVLTLIVIMMSNTILVSADISLDASDNATLISSKIDPELREIMDEAHEDELIPIQIWLKSIDTEIINQMMIDEYGMDPLVYKNEARFNKEVLPQIETEVVEKMGYEAAHAPVACMGISTASTKLSLLNPDPVEDNYEVTPIDEAVAEEFDSFLANKRTITKREYIELNAAFIQEYGLQEKDIIRVGKYIPTVIVKATKDKIKNIVSSEDIKEILYYEDVEVKNELDIVLNQTRVYGFGGTGTVQFNGSVYDGNNIKIGILEASRGVYDSNAAQLAGNSKLNIIENTDTSGTTINPVITNHATVVTSIIAGQEQVVTKQGDNGNNFLYRYKGVVPNAVIYQLPVSTMSSLMIGIDKLIDMGVHIINFSAGIDKGTSYSVYDYEVDMLIKNTDVIFVKSAGNWDSEKNNWNVTSPGKALNAITVGNAETKSSYSLGNSGPFNMSGTSCYVEDDYFPNKPDITAPGTRINIVKSSGETYPAGSGTSYAAPIVTGIIAQMLQRNSYLRVNPIAVKALLLLGADSEMIMEANDSIVPYTNLKEKSGAGLVNAVNAVRNTYESEYAEFATAEIGSYVSSGRYYFNAGDVVDAVMVYNKINTVDIDYYANMDRLDLYLVKSDEQTIVNTGMGTSGYNNVETIEYTITESGYYEFWIHTTAGAVQNKTEDQLFLPEAALAFNVE